jgi:hypothetical protein
MHFHHSSIKISFVATIAVLSFGCGSHSVQVASDDTRRETIRSVVQDVYEWPAQGREGSFVKYSVAKFKANPPQLSKDLLALTNKMMKLWSESLNMPERMGSVRNPEPRGTRDTFPIKKNPVESSVEHESDLIIRSIEINGGAATAIGEVKGYAPASGSIWDYTNTFTFHLIDEGGQWRVSEVQSTIRQTKRGRHRQRGTDVNWSLREAIEWAVDPQS